MSPGLVEPTVGEDLRHGRGVVATEVRRRHTDPERAVASRDTLVALGYAVEWHDYPMAHSVCAEEIADLNRWLLNVLGQP